MEAKRSLPRSKQPAALPSSEQKISRRQTQLWTFHKMAIFCGEELLAPRPTTKLEDHPLSAVRDCLFSVFTATLLFGDRSSIRIPRTRQAVVEGTVLS